MSLGVLNLEWLNHNSQRRYPLADDASGLDITSTFELPNDFIVGIDIPVNAGVSIDPGKFFVRNVGVFANGYSVVIGYNASTGPVNVASAMIPAEGHTLNQAYTLGGLSPYDDTVGKIVIGEMKNIAEQPPGYYTLSFAEGRLDPDAVRPQLRGVSSVVVVNGSSRSSAIHGDIEFVAGENMRLTSIAVSGQNPQVRFDAIAGEGLSDPCQCSDAISGPIYRINGVAPNADGDFFMPPGVCIEIAEVTNGLKFNNPCSQPCLGCDSLEQLTRELERLGSEKQAVIDFKSQLASSINSTQIILGSRLRDEGCVTCD